MMIMMLLCGRTTEAQEAADKVGEYLDAQVALEDEPTQDIQSQGENQ